MRFRRIALGVVAAMAIAVPSSLAVAVPASASGGNYWISEDPNNSMWNMCGVFDVGHNVPYRTFVPPPSCTFSDSGDAFTLQNCVTVNGNQWCQMKDGEGLCMNEVDNYYGNPNEQSILADSCVANDSHEEWHAFGVGNDHNALENRHTGHYMNIETQCQSITDCSKKGTMHTTAYVWAWSTPGAA